jgi:hypothetical protein
VVVPVFDGAAWLGDALASVAAQAEDLEVVVADDGSTDDTTGVLAAWALRLPLRVLRRPHTGNWAATANAAIREARGEFVCLLPQDDWWLPGRLERLRSAARLAPTIDFLFHDVRLVDGAGRAVGRWTCALPPAPTPVSSDRLLRALAVANVVAMPSPMVRREALVAAGLLDEGLWFTADWELWSRLAARGPALYLPETLACCRLHAASQTSVRTGDADDLRAQMASAAARALERAGASPRARRAAALNVELTVALAAAVHRRQVPWGLLRRAALPVAARPHEWWPFLRDSRLVARAWPRLQARG